MQVKSKIRLVIRKRFCKSHWFLLIFIWVSDSNPRSISQCQETKSQKA